MKSNKINRYANPAEQLLKQPRQKEMTAHQESPRLSQISQPMATKTRTNQDPRRTPRLRATPRAKNQTLNPVSAEETATSTMTVAVADATPETVTATVTVIAEDAGATMTAKRQNQRSRQTMS
jgi:hypothetical protein